uniref:Ras-related protein Rab-44 n=1 Tax=Malurus cyaneus samueli TaxID=2593467 RepID=A0A8C5U5R9_9PASS
MNEAIAALSKHLKAQADAPWDEAEPQTGPEAATAHGTTPEVLLETLPGHIHHEMQEGPGTAELPAPGVTQAGGSTRAQEPGAEQGESLEEAQRVLLLQGKGAGVEEMVLNVPEHLGESTKAGEQVLMEVEGAGWTHEKTGWEKPQLLGEAEEVEINQGGDTEAGLGLCEAGQEGVAAGQCLAVAELQPATVGVFGIPGECEPAPDTALQEWADPSSELPEKLQTELGEHLEPEPPSWGEAQATAARGDGVPEVTVAPGPGVLEQDGASAEGQPRGQTAESKELELLPARAERAGSSRAEGEEEEVEEAEPGEAEQQPQGECARGGAGQGGSAGAQEPLPPTHGQAGAGRTGVELEPGSPGTQQGGRVDPGVQLETEDKTEGGLGEEMGAAAVHSEGPSPAETPEGSPDLGGLFPVKSQTLELVEQICREGGRAVRIEGEEDEDGAQERGEHGLPQEPLPHPEGVTSGQGEGAGTGVQPQEEAESLDSAEEQSTNSNVQLSAEGAELKSASGESTEAELQPLSLGTEQGGSVDPDVQPRDQVSKEEVLEMETEDAQEDRVFREAEPGDVTAGGAGAAPRGCPKAPQDPDHLYNVLFVGDSHVGKTSFLYRLHADAFNPHLSATVGLDYQIKTLVVDNKCFALRLWDSAGQERYRSVTKQFFRKADGVVLMYDITSEYSFSDVRYWLSCIQVEDGVAVLLLGNKTDCAAQRQVPAKEGECLAKVGGEAERPE